eukprot:26715-Eustigmatos_ZCMA.PRE.1
MRTGKCACSRPTVRRTFPSIVSNKAPTVNIKDNPGIAAVVAQFWRCQSVPFSLMLLCRCTVSETLH